MRYEIEIDVDNEVDRIREDKVFGEKEEKENEPK
jgi:hypothetical protein